MFWLVLLKSPRKWAEQQEQWTADRRIIFLFPSSRASRSCRAPRNLSLYFVTRKLRYQNWTYYASLLRTEPLRTSLNNQRIFNDQSVDNTGSLCLSILPVLVTSLSLIALLLSIEKYTLLCIIKFQFHEEHKFSNIPVSFRLSLYDLNSTLRLPESIRELCLYLLIWRTVSDASWLLCRVCFKVEPLDYWFNRS